MVTVLLGLLIGAASPTTTADAATEDDLRCLVVSIYLVKNKDPELAKAGQMASGYFLGRIDGRTPHLDLEEAMVRVSKSMDEARVKAEAGRCGALLQQRGAAVVAMGRRIKQRGE